MAPICADAGRLQGVEQVVGKESVLHLLEAKSEGDTMTEPTDEDIAACIDAARIKCVHPDAETTVEIARAVLAKWGTPPVVAGEPVAWRSWDSENSRWNLTLWPDEWAGHPDVWEPLYTTPHPTQAQAGAVPLKPEQVAEIADAAHREYDRLVASGQCAPRWSAVFAHLLEQHHGIKGGQHGADAIRKLKEDMQ